MANLPNPRSWNQVIGDMVDGFLSRQGIPALKVGSPILSFIETAAQSDLRNTQDQLNFLKSTSLANATGTGLARQGADEGLQKLQDTKASGSVTVTDTSFQKVSSRIYQGLPAPIAGSSTVYIVDGTNFSSPTGSVYLGRGTVNYEGPIPYTAITQAGGYWSLTLSTPTQLFHNTGESVILAHGGNRSIGTGEFIQTPQGNASSAIQFQTLFTSIIPDGETSIDAVQVVAVNAGITGNVAAGAITSFVNPPFNGAVVTNPLPFTNATAQETDEAFRERIRATRASRTQGTVLAITTGVVGITSPDENKRVASASYVAPQGLTATLYIDDGTGYEEISQGVAIETIVAQAYGGEQYFSLASNPPVTKAAVTSLNSAPYNLTDASELFVAIGGLTVAPATFSATEFQNIQNATAYEVASAINAQGLLFSARVSDTGTTVTLFAKTDTAEGISVQAAPEGTVDANLALLFPVGDVETIRLYKNDVLLSKDGLPAEIVSNFFADWTGFGTTETLTIGVDGTTPHTYTFNSGSFSDAGTGFTSVSANSLEAWAAVFNANVVGTTTTVTGGQLTMVSNLGRSGRAALNITGGTLTNGGKIFSVQSVQGADNDYTLNRNTGQLALTTALVTGDSLSAGSTATRAFLQSKPLAPITVSSNGAKFFFMVDSEAQLITSNFSAALPLNFTVSPNLSAWGVRERIADPSNSAIFANVQSGDWLILWDSDLNVSAGAPTNQGVFRIASVDPSFNYVELERQGMPFGGAAIAMVALNNSANQILVMGGGTGGNEFVPQPYCAVYTPSTNIWTPVASMLTPRAAHTATLISATRVLVTGGSSATGNTPTTSCEIFTFSGTLSASNQGSWAAVASLPAAVSSAAAFLVPAGSRTGNVVVAGGYDANANAVATSYFYNPGTNTWGTGSPLNQARAAAPVAFISGSSVFLIAGGDIESGSGFTSTTSAELYSTSTNNWATTGPLSTSRAQLALVTLTSSTALAIGGFKSGGGGGTLSSCEIYSVGPGTWANTGSMSSPRNGPLATLLGDGTVLALGNAAGAEIFNGSTWSSVGPSLSATIRDGAAIVTTATGDALVAGGQDSLGENFARSFIYNHTTPGWHYASSFPQVTNQTLSHGGLAIVRGIGPTAARNPSQVQTVTIPAGSDYTASSLATSLASVAGATASVFRTTAVRINTNTFPVPAVDIEGGDIALVAANIDAQQFELPVSGAVDNLTPHMAAVTATGSDLGTPSFILYPLLAALSQTSIGVSLYRPYNSTGTPQPFPVSSSHFIVGMLNMPDRNTSLPRAGENQGFSSTIHDIVTDPTGHTSILNLREAVNVEWIPGDLVYAASHLGISPQDTLTVVLDNNPDSLRFTVPFFRRVQPLSSSNYGTTITLVDADNGGASLAQAFGYATGGVGGFDFSDFAVAMSARGLSHPGAAKGVLWRYTRLGADGNLAQIRYGYPALAGQSTPTVSTDFLGVNGTSIGANTNITVNLATGPARTGLTSIRGGSRFGISVLAPNTSGNATNRYLYTYILGFPIAQAQATGSVTLLTLALPPGILDHGLIVGNSVYVKSTNVNVASGLKTITAISTSGGGATHDQITYVAADTAGTYTNIGDVSYDTNEVTLTGSTVVAGDIVTVSHATSFSSQWVGITMSISSLGTQYFQGLVDTGNASITPTWQLVGNPAGLSFYPLLAAANTTSTICATVNGLAAATNSIVPVTGTVVGAGGTITQSSSDETGTPNFYHTFADGLNYVQSTSVPTSGSGNYSVTLKNPVSSPLVGNANDWAHEQFRLVPITTENLVEWFNTAAVTGLYNSAIVVASDGGHNLQVSSLTPGSSGAVQVQGGTANSVSAAVADYGVSVSTAGISNNLVCSVSTASSQGFTANTWVAVQNTNTVPRQAIFPYVNGSSQGTVLTGIVINPDSTATFTFSSSGFTESPIYVSRASVTAQTFVVHKTGTFVCFSMTDPDFGGALDNVIEGDWAYIYGATVNTTAIPLRVVRCDPNTQSFWVEDPQATFSPMFIAGSQTETCSLSINFVEDGAVIIGDTLKISTPAWGPGGSSNQGEWLVVGVGQSSLGGNSYQTGYTLTVSLLPSPQVPNPSSLVAFGPTTVLLTAQQANLIQVIEGAPARLIKFLTAICPDQVNGALTSLKFSTDNGYTRVGVTQGSLIQALDKLAFPTTIATGIDGYAHSTGLIEEANKVVYGVPSNTAAYPGIIASSANLNISGPLVKRITVSLSVRINTSTSTPADVQSRVQSTVAAVINQTGIGVPIALSDIIGAARSVNGVTSVTLISPAPSVTNDLITVQPFEKPLVLNLATDITVSIVGN